MEARTLQEALEVKELVAGDSGLRIDRVMLDNMTQIDSSQSGQHNLLMPWAGQQVVSYERQGNVDRCQDC